MKYDLNNAKDESTQMSLATAAKKFWPLIAHEKGAIAISFIAILLNSALNIVAPVLVGYAIDTYFFSKNFNGILGVAGILLAMYIGALIASYVQTRVMGGVAQRMLFTLRGAIFSKLQQLPVAFFNQNKAGDLISRINNDTDKLNQFFSQALMQFVGNAFMIVGVGIVVLVLDIRLGAVALAPALALVVITRLLSAWIKRKNAKNLKDVGGMSANIQESLNNFKVIAAFDRRDYFRERFASVNNANYASAIGAGIANTLFTPIYGLSSNIALLLVIAYGTHLISLTALSIGLLITFITYVNRFYDPLRQMAALWSSFQLALASWDRISDILALETNLPIIPSSAAVDGDAVLTFRDVRFGYPDGKEVLGTTNFSLEKGKTYALVGPTGGGKTTTASLMARLYDPTAGTVLLNGKDIRSYETAERAKKIGFILQEPFLFTGTIHDNIVYGNDELATYTAPQLLNLLATAKLDGLMTRFDKGLETPVLANGEAISLGQRQIIAFIRAVLRKPELLILDEATANIDTVTEQVLQEILNTLPATTTRVIIAHRLNTIENADEIFFVNGGAITRAGSLAHAVNMLLDGKRES